MRPFQPFITFTTSSFKPGSDDDYELEKEEPWVIDIRRTLAMEMKEETEFPASIFSVPRALMASDPDSYTPQQVALGPYHCHRPELYYETQKYKLAAAKRMQKHLQDLKFEEMVDKLMEDEAKIRACYHKYLDFNSKALAWMMALDASFLLEFLQVYVGKEGKTLTRETSPRTSLLANVSGGKSAYSAILRDVAMLENQIPLFIMRKILEFQFSSAESAEEVLELMLVEFCGEVMPFKEMSVDFPKVGLAKSAHLLDFLYQVMVPRVGAPPPPSSEIINENQEAEQKKEDENDESTSLGKSSHVKQFFGEIWKLLKKLNIVKKVLFSRPLKFILRLPWKFMSNLPVIRIWKQPIEELFLAEVGELSRDNENSSLNNTATNKPPLVEEIKIPSVTQLFDAGITFLPTNGGIESIHFDVKARKLSLPAITLDVNTEVVLRNLVAYEACTSSGQMVVTRYADLMNGIVDTEEDSKLLRRSEVFKNRLKSDQEAVKIWNELSKSVRVTNVPHLDRVIEEVNKYYDGRWKVKVGNMIKVYVFQSWRFLTVLAALMLLILMTFQSFCSVYSCARWFSSIGL